MNKPLLPVLLFSISILTACPNLGSTTPVG